MEVAVLTFPNMDVFFILSYFVQYKKINWLITEVLRLRSGLGMKWRGTDGPGWDECICTRTGMRMLWEDLGASEKPQEVTGAVQGPWLLADVVRGNFTPKWSQVLRMPSPASLEQLQPPSTSQLLLPQSVSSFNFLLMSFQWDRGKTFSRTR